MGEKNRTHFAPVRSRKGKGKQKGQKKKDTENVTIFEHQIEPRSKEHRPAIVFVEIICALSAFSFEKHWVGLVTAVWSWLFDIVKRPGRVADVIVSPAIRSTMAYVPESN